MIVDISLPDADMGNRMGIALAPIGIASLIGPPIVGAILGKDYDWWKAILFSSVSVNVNRISHIIVLIGALLDHGCRQCWIQYNSTSSLPQTDAHPNREYSLIDDLF
jgi:hypothetical protein